MESFSQMAERWIQQNVPAAQPLPDAKYAQKAKEGCPHDLAHHDASVWHEDFTVWVLSHCIFRDRVFWSVAHLNALFGAWCVSTNRVPCRLDIFEELLRSEDFLLADGLVYGLMPKKEQATIDDSIRDARSNNAQ